MCGNKVPFPTRKSAQRVADKYEQRVYNCPVCHCYHTTSKQDWKEEYIHESQLKNHINNATQVLRRDHKAYTSELKGTMESMRQDHAEEVKALNCRINEVQHELGMWRDAARTYAVAVKAMNDRMGLIFEYFDNDHAKINAWFRTENPSLGGVRPLDMLSDRERANYLKRFIDEAEEHNSYGIRKEETAPENSAA